MSICLSVRLSVRPSVCPVGPSVGPSVRPSVCPSVCQTVTVGQSAYRTAEYFFNCGSLTKRSEWMADFSYQNNRCMNSKYNNVNSFTASLVLS